MKDAGYTLTDTLASLAILGLILGALAPGVATLAKNQFAIDQQLRQSQSMKRGEAALDYLLAQGGPFTDRAGGLRGEPDHFTFPCQAGVCRADLRVSTQGQVLVVASPEGEAHVTLVGVTEAHFAYVGSRTEGSLWPQSTDQFQPLRAIAVVGAQANDIVLQARLWPEHGPDCAFDVISQDCRA